MTPHVPSPPSALSRLLHSSHLLPGHPRPTWGRLRGLSRASPWVQDQEKALDKYEHVVQSLQKRGQQVVPLKYRRETPLKPIPVEALCDFEGDQVSCCPGAPGKPGPKLPLGATERS